jgi:hypothetical protein
MNRNVGGLDRSARLIVGSILAIAGIVVAAGFWELGTVVGAGALVVGAVLLVTGATQKCPLNSVAGVDTTE